MNAINKLLAMGTVGLAMTLGGCPSEPNYPGVVVKHEMVPMHVQKFPSLNRNHWYYLHVGYTEPGTGATSTRRIKVNKEEFGKYAAGDPYP